MPNGMKRSPAVAGLTVNGMFTFKASRLQQQACRDGMNLSGHVIISTLNFMSSENTYVPLSGITMERGASHERGSIMMLARSISNWCVDDVNVRPGAAFTARNICSAWAGVNEYSRRMLNNVYSGAASHINRSVRIVAVSRPWNVIMRSLAW